MGRVGDEREEKAGMQGTVGPRVRKQAEGKGQTAATRTALLRRGSGPLRHNTHYPLSPGAGPAPRPLPPGMLPRACPGTGEVNAHLASMGNGA